ncbi:MAG: hypothetical protein CO090_04525 [Acidobacteria bacterium CG_4_9_14_3_um_filter_49_7]|nr:MAG: hypothetical protein CO090_04525 [Acidobacteria bacterium CG_4_9_14_3_um_filter_49_7]
MEQTIILTESELQLHGGTTGTVHAIPVGGALNPLNVDHPVRDGKIMAEAVASAGRRLNRRKGCNILLPDSLVFAKVLTFDKIPFSLKKRDEMIRWKMDAFLPGRVTSFNVQYTISGNTVLVAAMPKSAVAELIAQLNLLNTKCFSMIPESFYYANAFLEREKEGSAVLFVNRSRHFSGLVVRNGMVSFVRFRKKIQDVSLREELDMFAEMVGVDVPDRVLLFGEEAEIEAETMGNRWLI